MTLLICILIALGTFAAMEFAAWATHRFVMHGFMWHFHKDHHDGGYHPFQKNDVFFLIYAIPSWLCIQFGWQAERWYVVAVGVGILLYGIAYFLVHDVVVHQRFKWFTRSNSRYVKAIRWAHKMHHKHRGKEDGESFGLLVFSKKYWEKVKRDEALQAS